MHYSKLVVPRNNSNRKGKKKNMRHPGLPLKDLPNVKTYIVHGNQFEGENGGAACASISFEAAYFMTFANTPKEVVHNIRWETDVLHIGKMLWKGWVRDKYRKDDHFLSLTDIIAIPGLETYLQRMGERTELCGPLFSVSDEEYARKVLQHTDKDTDAIMVMTSIMVRFEDALIRMQAIALDRGEGRNGHTTAILFYRHISISLYAHADGTFVVYDSHGIGLDEELSQLYVCTNRLEAKGIVRGLMHVAGSSLRPEEASIFPENFYVICIFSSPICTLGPC